MSNHFQQLLESIAVSPDQPIGLLPLLSDTERQKVLVEWNNTWLDLPLDRCVHHLFEAQVLRTPEAIAVVEAHDRGLPEHPAALTYSELNERANQLAHYLQNLGVGPDTLVGICLERSLDMAIALLGILKAGGAYVPLDPAYPAERLRFMLEDAAAPIVLTKQQLRDQLVQNGVISPVSAQAICLDRAGEAIAQQPRTNPESGAASAHLMYVIYTSGSTGKPKGVLVSHRSALNHNLAAVQMFGLDNSDRMLQFATINFDAAVEEIFPTWLSGATLVLRPDGPVPTGIEFLDLIAHTGVTILDLPTAYWHAWVSEMARSGRGLPPSLRLVVVGGEEARTEGLVTWQTLDGAERVRWINTYGPTEATIIATHYEADMPRSPGGHRIPIGRPLANTHIYLLDKHMNPVPIGIPGELYIGGVGVARGYLNRPELTSERFMPDPFCQTADARLYKTGDLARYLPDGNIEFLGRRDTQVKIRGFRIELGEIETSLTGYSTVSEAVVLAQPDNLGGQRLVAYVVASSIVTPTDLRRFLQERLPDYMVPSAFVLLDSIPLTPSGKVDYRALPIPNQVAIATDIPQTMPHNQAEEALAAIWQQVLGIPNLGIHDNFFELGGDSILSIQVIARANQSGLRLSAKHMFQAPTIAGLAALAGTDGTVHAEQGIVTGSLPLTPIQRWFFEQQFPDPHHWNQALLLEVREQLDPDLLNASIRRLLEQHDALRLRFRHDGYGWQQINASLDEQIPVTWIDLVDLPVDQQRSAIEATAAENQASLNITTGPLLRAVYFNLGTDRPGRLLLAIHHLAVDGVSWRILLEDFQTVYQQLRQGSRVELPPKTTSFQYWAQRLVEYAQSQTVRNELDYWLALVKNTHTHLPIDFPSGINSEASDYSIAVSLESAETQALLQDVPKAYSTQINDVLLTALARSICRWTRMRSMLIELEGHGRQDLFEDVDISRTVGWLTSFFPVRLDLGTTHDVGANLKAVKEQLRRIPQQGIGYGLLRYLNSDPDLVDAFCGFPKASISFNYLGQVNQGTTANMLLQIADESRGPDRNPAGMRSYLLDITGSIVDGCLHMEWSYSKNMHRHTTIERLAQDFATELRTIITHCQTPESSGYTPSDFELANLDQRKLNKVLAKISQKKEKKSR